MCVCVCAHVCMCMCIYACVYVHAYNKLSLNSPNLSVRLTSITSSIHLFYTLYWIHLFSLQYLNTFIPNSVDVIPIFLGYHFHILTIGLLSMLTYYASDPHST